MKEIPQAFSLQNLILAKDRMPHESWREYVDTQAKYFTREYILQENITKYHLNIVRDSLNNPVAITDPVSGEDISKTFQRGINMAVNQSLLERALAEEEGFCGRNGINETILSGKGENRFFIWISEPGRIEDGFSDHSFTFIGHILEDRVDMVAYKNWVNKATNRRLLSLEESCSEIELLKKPLFFQQGRFDSYLDIIDTLDPLRSIQTPDDNEWFLDSLAPFREAIINSLEMGDELGAKRAKNAHDNYALALLRGEGHKENNISYWGDQPAPVLSGSCGFSGEGAALTWLGMEGRYFKCPRCLKKLPAGRGIVVCTSCGLYKGDYQPKSGQRCA